MSQTTKTIWIDAVLPALPSHLIFPNPLDMSFTSPDRRSLTHPLVVTLAFSLPLGCGSRTMKTIQIDAILSAVFHSPPSAMHIPRRPCRVSISSPALICEPDLMVADDEDYTDRLRFIGPLVVETPVANDAQQPPRSVAARDLRSPLERALFFPIDQDRVAS